MSQEIKNKEPKISLVSLVNAAENEDWKTADDNIPKICDEPPFVEWSLKDGVYNQDPNLRDLGVSILEKSEHELNQEEVEKLRELMSADENVYVQYRSAFALFNHGIRDQGVIEKMNSATEDDDVKDIAQKYLGQLKFYD